MNENNRQLSRRLASEALSELSTPGYPFELVVRKALRVATLRNHTYVSAWLRLQLLDVMSGERDLEKTRQLFDDLYPDRRSEELKNQVLDDYFMSRSLTNQKDKIYGAAVGELERNVKIGLDIIENATGRIPQDFMVSTRTMDQMLNSIKNRAQTYLMEVEADEGSAETDELM